MIKEIKKRASRGKLHVQIETKIKNFYSHPDQVLTDDQVLEIAKEDHEIIELISRPDYQVGNYIGSNTKQMGEWVFKIKPKAKKPSTKSSIRSKISKIAKDRKENVETKQ